MRGYHFISKANEAVGRITKQNQTHDVGPNEIKTQAKKFGNSVDKDGRPPVLHRKAKKNTKPNTLFNLGMAEGKRINEVTAKDISKESEIYVER